MPYAFSRPSWLSSTVCVSIKMTVGSISFDIPIVRIASALRMDHESYTILSKTYLTMRAKLKVNVII